MRGKLLGNRLIIILLPALTMITEAIHKSDKLPLDEGLKHERKLFYSLFDTDDQKEGMRAFIEKRKPTFKGS